MTDIFKFKKINDKYYLTILIQIKNTKYWNLPCILKHHNIQRNTWYTQHRFFSMITRRQQNFKRNSL